MEYQVLVGSNPILHSDPGEIIARRIKELKLFSKIYRCWMDHYITQTYFMSIWNKSIIMNSNKTMNTNVTNHLNDFA